MPAAKTITISVPVAMGREIAKVAKSEHRTISELIRETFRQYLATRNLHQLAKEGRKAVRSKRITPKYLGGPFEN